MPFAEVPQARCVFVSYLRKFRKQEAFLYYICGNSASKMHLCVTFAEVPQARSVFVPYLRKFRKQNVHLCNICGSSANKKRFCIIFAEVPQAKNVFVQYLRQFRKRGAFSDKVFLGDIDGVGIVGEVKSGSRWDDVEWGACESRMERHGSILVIVFCKLHLAFFYLNRVIVIILLLPLQRFEVD